MDNKSSLKLKCTHNQSKLSTSIIKSFLCDINVHLILRVPSEPKRSILLHYWWVHWEQKGDWGDHWKVEVKKERKEIKQREQWVAFSYRVRNGLQNPCDGLISGFCVDQLSCTPIRYCQITISSFMTFLYIKLNLLSGLFLNLIMHDKPSVAIRYHILKY